MIENMCMSMWVTEWMSLCASVYEFWPMLRSLHDIFSSLIHCWNWRWWWCWFLSSGLSGKQLTLSLSLVCPLWNPSEWLDISIIIVIIKCIRLKRILHGDGPTSLTSLALWPFSNMQYYCSSLFRSALDNIGIDNLPCTLAQRTQCTLYSRHQPHSTIADESAHVGTLTHTHTHT